MNILVACEESQAVTIELRKLGHRAFSCDLMECSGGHPEWHIQGDAVLALQGGEISTMDGRVHDVGEWEMLIAHPPCTYLSNAGAARLYKRIGEKSYCDLERLNKGFDARDFFMEFYNANIPKKAIENPIPSGVYRLPKYTQIVQPYMFGDPWHKKTCLWLEGLPPLKETDVVEPKGWWVQRSGKSAKGCFGGHRDPKMRSKTFTGIAKAMAEQWAGPCEERLI